MDGWHTNACCVHSNVYGLGNVHWIRYLTPVDPFHSTSSVVQTYHHMMCIHVEITKSTTIGISGNFRSIGKKPVPYDGPIFILIILSTTSNWVCNTEQGIIIFINVLQGHETVVLVFCTIEWELNITYIYNWRFMQKNCKHGCLIL